MRASSRPIAVLKAGSLLAMALVCASPAEATRAAHPDACRGVLALSAHAVTDAVDRAHLSRATYDADRDDDEAIQNDAPAAWTDVGERTLPHLTPIGLLVRTVDARPSTLDASPKPPRGPPAAA